MHAEAGLVEREVARVAEGDHRDGARRADLEVRDGAVVGAKPQPRLINTSLIVTEP